MSKWFYINIVLLLIAVWQITKYPILPGRIHILIGFVGLLFFLFNWTRHAVFSTIRNAPDRNTKIKFANLSKKAMPIHRWTGTTALVIIMIHAVFIIDQFGLQISNIKMTSGLIAGTVLIALVTSGWMRLFRPTVRKRKAHLYLAMVLFVLITIHLLA